MDVKPIIDIRLKWVTNLLEGKCDFNILLNYYIFEKNK